MKHTHERRDWSESGRLLVLVAVLFSPYVIFADRLQRLFWFGDDLDLVWQIDEYGLWSWIARPWVESFSPLFKCVWSATLLGGNGSYYAMLGPIWLGTAATGGVLAMTLRRVGVSWGAIGPAILVFAISPTTIETMTWSVQLSPVLANFLFCLALHLYVRAFMVDSTSRSMIRKVLPSATASLASALCYSRGILTAIILSVMSLWPVPGERRAPLRRIGMVALAYLGPVSIVLFVILFMAGGNQSRVGSLMRDPATLFRMAEFGFSYFVLNPFHGLLGMETFGPRTSILLGLMKVGLYILAWRRAAVTARWVVVALAMYDVANAAILGLGRYHTGLEAVISSRYQQVSLTSIAPCAAFILHDVLLKVPTLRGLRLGASVVVAAGIAWPIFSTWPRSLDTYIQWRGDPGRTHLTSNAPLPPGFTVPGIDFMPVEKARHLVRDYNLH